MKLEPLWSTLAPEEIDLTPPRVLNLKAIRDAMPGATTYAAAAKAQPSFRYIGREMKPHGLEGSEWANTAKITEDTPEARAAAIREFVVQLLDNANRSELGILAGRDLLCWCSPKLCHGDALAELIKRTKFYGSKCPHCSGPVKSFMNWHEGLQVLAEAWVCQAKECSRRGERRRDVPSCLLTAQPFLL